jgi:hypothetical protein
MDNKTVFIRTSKGEDEMHSRTTHLPGDIKRALLMVDGVATFNEISKRAAPSLRASLGEMLQELEKGGFIQDKDPDKDKIQSKAQEKAQEKFRSDNIPKMAVPVKMSTPQKNQPVVNKSSELDFMSGFGSPSHQAPAADPVKTEKAREAPEQISKQDIEAAKFNAQREAEAILFRAEQEAERIREETARRAKADAEATRVRAELEAKRVRDELAASKLKAEQEARLRLEAAAKEQQQAEAARKKAEQEADQVRIELEAAKIRAEMEAKVRLEAAAKARALIQAEEAARIREEAERIARQERETARIREEAERIARQEQEAARIREEVERIARQEQEAARIREEAERIARQERETARIREEAERIVRQEQEAARIHEEAERIARQEQEAARIREESERLVRHEQKVREETERIIKQEQRVREETERIIRQEQEAARSSDAASREQTARETESKSFSFDSFQVDAPLYTSESHIDRPPAQKENKPAQKARPVEAPPAGKAGGFSFDAFKVDEPPHAVEPARNRQPAQNARPAQQPAAAAKSVQPAEGQRPVKQQPVPQSKPFDGQPSQEQIQRAMQERKAVEERIAAEALEAKKMAEAQAKVWAEAEQRALEVAKAEVAQVAKQATFTIADAQHVAKSAPVSRVTRKTFSWGKMLGFVFKLGLFLLVLLVGALFILPYVVPMRDYMPAAEQMLSAKLHQPVHIGKLSGRILPMPRLEVGEIYIGDSKQFQADIAQINFDLAGIFTEEKPVSSIEFQGVKVRGAWVRNVAEWLQKMANEEKYPVSRIVISKGKLDADVFEMNDIEGELNFDPAGKFTQTNLRANAGKYSLGINANPLGKLQVAIKVHGGTLPLLSNWVFDDLTAKGELNNNGLAISAFDAHILGGVLQGNADFDWHSGWRVQGAITAKTIAMQQLNHLLEGNLEGTARFKMTSLDLGGLVDSAALDGSFTSSNGTIGGMDIVETTRKRSKENLPGGRTHYDALTGVVSYANGVYHFKQTKISSSTVTANAAFDVDAKQQLSGKMSASLSLKDTVAGQADLQMGGAIDSPTLRYAP